MGSVQFSLPYLPTVREHGGEKLKTSHAKTARPLATRCSMHVVFKASSARGELSLLRKRHAESVRRLLCFYSRRFHVRVYHAANVGNHIHLLVKARTRDGMRAFLRAFPGTLAMAVTGAKNGRPLAERFWDAIVFTRVVSWGREFARVVKYVGENQIQGRAIFSLDLLELRAT